MAVYDITKETPKKILKGDILNCPYSNKSQSITLPRGKYKLEVWGAAGGTSGHSSSTANRGGYSVGTLTISSSTTVYLYSGGKGGNGSNSYSVPIGGFNGGGGAGPGHSDNAGGGGGSDIRIGTDSLYARVIVAGGAGGNACSSGVGGLAGGTSGSKGTGGQWGGAGYGGTQTSGGSGGGYNSNAGSFGAGGSGPSGGSWGCGGGGGGWYGGGSGNNAGGGGDAGGGGSGYIFTKATSKAYPSGCLLSESYYLSDAKTLGGGSSFPSTSGGTESGHRGDGYCRITVIEGGLNSLIIGSHGNPSLLFWGSKKIVAMYISDKEVW